MKVQVRPMKRSRKRMIRRMQWVVMTICTMVVAALLAHPWKTAPANEGSLLTPQGNDAYMEKYFATYATSAPADPPLATETIARGLRSPDGLAIDPYSGSLFISEEDAAQIIQRDSDGATRVVIDANTPVFDETDEGRIAAPGLRSPEGLAFERNGCLYVVEDVPDGRLISFALAEYHPGGQTIGTVIPFPSPGQGYAWESIAIGRHGELLLAGSNIEAFLGDRTIADMYSGAVLYRDADGEWWVPLYRPLESYSAVCFDPEGRYAYFASEIMGYIGCFDLNTHVIQTWFSDTIIHSPEGVTCLPDGTAIVAAEGGKIMRIDPYDSHVTEVYDVGSDIETVYWDAARSRLLITSDGNGEVISLTADAFFNYYKEVQGKLELIPSLFTAEIPRECPDYLVNVLNLCGFNPLDADPQTSFHTFARNVSMFAVDADAVLMPSSDPISDPVKKIQFVIFTPHFFGVDLSGLSGPTSGFVAAYESGAMDRTRMHKRSMMHVDLWEGQFTFLNQDKIALPYPSMTRLTPEGTASVSFMGYGETPDYHVILNMKDPTQSYMVAMHLDGTYQEYKLMIPEGKDIDHWIVGIKTEVPEMWTKLNQPVKMAAR